MVVARTFGCKECGQEKPCEQMYIYKFAEEKKGGEPKEKEAALAAHGPAKEGSNIVVFLFEPPSTKA